MDPVTPNDVQPEGQGAAESTSGLYDLSSVPEHLRGAVEPILKGFDANVTKKFQEHSDYRKGWEPYERLGVNQVDPEELSELLEFQRIWSDPTSRRAWYEEMRDHVLGEDAEDDLGDDEPVATDGQTDVAKLVAEAVKQAMAPIMQEREQAQADQQRDQQMKAITSELDALEQEHGKFDRERVCQMALLYGEDPDGLKKGYADYQALIAEARKDFVARSMDQPETPNQGGQAVSAVSPPKTYDEARSAALQLLRNSTAA